MLAAGPTGVLALPAGGVDAGGDGGVPPDANPGTVTGVGLLLQVTV